MTCIHCQGMLKRSQSPLHIDRNSIHVTLDKVPAWVCEQCGEAMFDEKEVEKVIEQSKKASEEKEVETIQDLIKLLEDKSQALQRSA